MAARLRVEASQHHGDGAGVRAVLMACFVVDGEEGGFVYMQHDTPGEGDGRDSRRIQRQRAEDVMGAFARGSAEKAWSTYWRVDHGLVWDHEREVWVDGDGHAYDGSRFGIGSRRPHAA